MGLKIKWGRWHYRFMLRGQRYEGSTGLEATRQNENAAKAIEAARRLEEEGGTRQTRSTGIPFGVAATEFLLWCHSTEYRKKPNSAHRISGSFASLKEFFRGFKVHEIEPIDIERYKTWRLEEHKIKEVSLRNDLNALSIFFGRYAKKAGWCRTNPFKNEDEKIKRPSGEDAIRMYILSADEEKAYFDVAQRNPNLHDCGKLMLLQGPRPEEVLSLKKSSYLRATGQIKIEGGKTKAARRTLDLCSESIEIIERRMRSPGIWLFPSSRKPGDHIRQLHTTHDSVCQDASVSFVMYDLRHTFATRYACDAGGDLPTLAALLGHSGLRVVQKYVHAGATHMREGMRNYETKTRPPRLELVKKSK